MQQIFILWGNRAAHEWNLSQNEHKQHMGQRVTLVKHEQDGFGRWTHGWTQQAGQKRKLNRGTGSQTSGRVEHYHKRQLTALDRINCSLEPPRVEEWKRIHAVHAGPSM
jgi:hypothetical protein